MGKNQFIRKFREYIKSEECFIEHCIDETQERICEVMDEQGVSQVDLAKNLKETPQNINRFFKRGHNSTLATLFKIFFALNRKVMLIPLKKNINESNFYKYIKDYKEEDSPIKSASASISKDDFKNNFWNSCSQQLKHSEDKKYSPSYAQSSEFKIETQASNTNKQHVA